MGYVEPNQHGPNFNPTPSLNGAPKMLTYLGRRAAPWFGEEPLPQPPKAEERTLDTGVTPGVEEVWPPQPNEWNGTDEVSRLHLTAEDVKLAINGLGTRAQERKERSNPDDPPQLADAAAGYYYG
jgi:hypothetical protein